MNPASVIRARILGKNNAGKKKSVDESDIIEMQHRIMVVYGWISVKDLLEMPIPMFFGLYSKAEQEYKEMKEHKAYVKAIYKGLGGKN